MKTIKINNVEDLKQFILNNDLTEDQIINLVFATLKVFINCFDEYKTIFGEIKKDEFMNKTQKSIIVKKIDEVVKNYPIGIRPFFLDYSLTE